MIKRLIIYLLKLVLAWAVTGLLIRGLFTYYHLPPPSWLACLLMVLLLDSAGKILRGELSKVDE